MAPSKTDQAADPDTATLEQSVALVRQQCDEILGQLKAVNDQLAQVTVRESELRAVIGRDTDLDSHLDGLRKIIKRASTAEKIGASIDRAELHLEPFPYAVVDDFLPAPLYEALLMGLPPVELFTNKPAGKEHLSVPFDLAPIYSQRVWRFLASRLVPTVIAPRIIEKFRPQIDEWITRNWPSLDPESVELRGTSGRIMFRRRGYRILPHRDPKWSFITCIMYLARPNDSESWGTQLYAVEQDEEAKSAAPFWIDQKRCRLVRDVENRANRVLVFLNSVGAHGAHIPADAQPENLERYIYQFRVGPTPNAISMLKSMLPEERQQLWTGKALVDY